jgi:hypothetical protein
MKNILICAVLCIALPAHAAAPGDAALGKKLHDAHCTGCHDSSVYTRKDHHIKSLGALKEQLVQCTHAAQVTLTDEEQQSVVRYLNDQFYKFK